MADFMRAAKDLPADELARLARAAQRRRKRRRRSS
jgi:hypothetical protein